MKTFEQYFSEFYQAALHNNPHEIQRLLGYIDFPIIGVDIQNSEGITVTERLAREGHIKSAKYLCDHFSAAPSPMIEGFI
jgi:hypothetical protein